MIPAFKATIEKASFTIRILSARELEFDGQVCKYDLSQLDGRGYSLILDGTSFSAQLLPESPERSDGAQLRNGGIGRTLSISINGSVYSLCIDDHRSLLLRSYFNHSSASSGIQIVRAPMPGLISRIEVKLGDEVSIGRGLIVLEAMKMENEIRSLYHGRILDIHAERGKAVDKGEQLITIEEMSQK